MSTPDDSAPENNAPENSAEEPQEDAEPQERTPLPAFKDPSRRQRVNGFAIASLVCGILGWLPFVFGLALIFASTAKRQIRERGDGGRGLATAGSVLGWVWFAVLLVSAYNYWTM